MIIIAYITCAANENLNYRVDRDVRKKMENYQLLLIWGEG
jgi:hypothetical protein